MTNAPGTTITPGTIVSGKYRLERPVSRGGMGSVWAAQHLQLGATVALKFMDPSYAASPAFQARFQREAQVAARIDSPHVVKVQDYGIDALGPYIVMELLRGVDLEDRLKQRGRLPLPEVSLLLQQLGKALRRAHEAGLIHRDLKPRNLFLARVDDEEVLKVLDFGIAKDTTGRSVAESTSTGELMGSPHYMSPEQLRADRGLDPRSDLWSVGVILFRCLTGRLPFQGDVLGTVMAAVLVDPVPSAIGLAPDLPPGIDAFFARALARDREQRFQSIRDLVDGFAQATGGAPLGVTTAGVQMSPFAAPGAAFGPVPPVPSSGPMPSSAPDARASRVSFPAGALPGMVPAHPAAPISAETPVGTLTSAGVTGGATARARRMRAVWIAGALTLAVVIGGAALTVQRLTQGETEEAPETAAAAAAAPVPVPVSVSVSVPVSVPVSAPVSVSAPVPAPAAAADTATAAAAATATEPKETKTAAGPKPPATAKGNPPPSKPTSTITAPTKKPSWGF